MATIIIQKPAFSTIFPVGQEVMFGLKNTTVTQNQIEVKFVARVHISDVAVVNLSSTAQQVGIFKTVPNNEGIGMFNFRNVIESYVSADHLNGKNADVKGVNDPVGGAYPLHMIDKLSRNRNLSRYFAVKFSVEYLDTDPASSTYNQIVEQDFANSVNYNIFNGYIPFDAYIKKIGNDFGFDMDTSSASYIVGQSNHKFLSNMPTTLYANKEDYMTIPVFMDDSSDFDRYIITAYSKFPYASIGSATTAVNNNIANGGGAYNAKTGYNFLYLGIGPANIRQWFSGFETSLAADGIGFYTIKLYNSSNAVIADTLTIYVDCDKGNPNIPTPIENKGYEPIRLCWLNQWGGWDYYTFRLKSTKTFNTESTTYNQLGGSWNEEYYRTNSFKGGKKTFRVNTKEVIKVNSNYVTEEEALAFEYLINSPEVFMLTGYVEESASTFNSNTNNQYVIPVTLNTKSITRKTKANDKLIQYTFDVEKTKTLRTQSI